MGDFWLKGYAARIVLEATSLPGDAIDKERYYRLEAGMEGSSKSKTCTFTVLDETGAKRISYPNLAVDALETSEHLSSDQTASLHFNGGADIAQELRGRMRPMDRVRVEMTNGSGFKLAFDGFLSSEMARTSSTPEGFNSKFSLTANGLWKLLTQSWFNWQGVINPNADVLGTQEGQSLFNWLAQHLQVPAQDIVRKFIEVGLSVVELETSEGKLRPVDGSGNGFFAFGNGGNWKSAFDLAFPVPSKTLPSWKGPLTGMIQMLAQPDIHECFCTYLDDGIRERPTIIFRPRPFPGAEGDDEGWKSLRVHVLHDEPAAKTSMFQRNDSQRPNVFHWEQGSSSDGSLGEFLQKVMHGFVVDKRSLARYGYSARPVGTSLPPLAEVPKGDRGAFVDTVKQLMHRVAYQEAPLPEMWNRTIHLPLRPGIHPGEVVEEYSDGVPWTGYVVSVQHRLSGSPWGGHTSIALTRCLQCTAEDYPEESRALVNIEFRPYIESNASGAATPETTKMAVSHPQRVDMLASHRPLGGVPYGAALVAAGDAHGVPAWVVAHMARSESSFNTKVGNGGGMMQFLPGTANDLNNQGYPKPFSYEMAKKDPVLSADAAAWYVGQQKKTVDKLAPATLSERDRWAWAMYGYQQGPGALQTHGPASDWQFGPIDRARPEYRVYWGPSPTQSAQQAFGGLG